MCHHKAHGYALLDVGYDSDEIREIVKSTTATAVIAYRKSRTEILEFDKHLYKERHKVENLFQKLKRYRCIATRYKKTHLAFKAMITIASIMIFIKA